MANLRFLLSCILPGQLQEEWRSLFTDAPWCLQLRCGRGVPVSNWRLTSINAVCVTKASLRQVQNRVALISVVWSMLCLQTQALLGPAASHWLSPLTVKPLLKQAFPCQEGQLFSSWGLPSCPAFILTSWFWLLQKRCWHSRWSWYFCKRATSLPFPPPCSWLLFPLSSGLGHF